jgi:lipopolysaccharide/colanic/teichoic acid biosynthesis glycosyltransferase
MATANAFPEYRWVDVPVAAVALVVLAPFFLIIAVAIRLTSPGPVFYRAERVGQGGRPFRLFKFRSMVVNAAQLGPGITTAADRRVTPLGQWLRQTKLDELPQLLNVVLGDMNLIGPRPEDPRYVARYTPEQRAVLQARPGMTSPASVRYRAEEQLLTGADWETTYLTVILPDKLRLELEYLRRRTLWSDLGLLWQTAVAVALKG